MISNMYDVRVVYYIILCMLMRIEYAFYSMHTLASSIDRSSQLQSMHTANPPAFLFNIHTPWNIQYILRLVVYESSQLVVCKINMTTSEITVKHYAYGYILLQLEYQLLLVVCIDLMEYHLFTSYFLLYIYITLY